MINNAAEYAQWRQSVIIDPSAATEAAGATMLSRVVIELLATDQFYGELLTRLPRQLVATLTSPFALAWRDNQLVLQYGPNAVARTFLRFDSLQAGLKHVALHVVWQHPLRYREQVATQHQLVTLATDLAVNQYVDGLPDEAVRLATVQPLVTTKLPLKADSGIYLKLLQQQQQPDKQDDQSQSGQATTGDDRQPSVGDEQTPPIDDVQSWTDSGQLTNPNLAAARLQQLAKDAWAQTNEVGRGLVAGKVAAQLAVQRHAPQIDWRQLLARGVGQIPSGKQLSRARFNRRQPFRMELPGQISETRLDLQVYVDNSGSISDTTLQQLLSQVATLTQMVTATITVKAFDAIVQPGQTYQASLPQQIRFTRRGGGGTVYQAIFDDLAAHHLTNATTLALILTDGRGEAQVEPHRFTNVVWLLASANDHLSVNPVIGRVVNLKIGDDEHGTTA